MAAFGANTVGHAGFADDRRWMPGIDYLLETRLPDGTWPGRPDAAGPGPLLTHWSGRTQALVALGLRAARAYLRAMVSV